MAVNRQPGREIPPIAGSLVLKTSSLAPYFAGELAGSASPPEEPLSLWYRQPAIKWSEALPIGNGRLGAMVFGGLGQERLQFNDDTIWTGEPHEYQHEGAVEFLPTIRQLLKEGQQREAENLAMQEFMSNPIRQKTYQPCGDLLIDFPPAAAVRDYRRDLNLDTAVASVSYRIGDVTFRRQAFVSHPDQAIVWHITADKPGHINLSVRLASPHLGAKTGKAINDSETNTEQNNRFLELTGQVRDGAIKFEARVQLTAQGGKTRYGEGEITLENADSALVTLVAASNFRNYRDVSASASARCEAAMQALAGKTFETLLANSRGGSSTTVSSSDVGPGHHGDGATAHRRTPEAGGQSGRPATGNALLPIWPLLVDHQLSSRHPTRQSAGNLE